MILEGTFKSINNKVYYIELSKDDGNDIGYWLKFSDDPVEITYESEENIYKPIKASSATITIVTEEYYKDLYSISGRDVSVVIYDSTDDTVVWKGYLTPNIYSQDYDEPLTELELECQDELSALKYISANNLSGTYTIRNLITTILNITNDDIVSHFTNMYVYDTLRYYFTIRGNRKLFLDDTEITDDNIRNYTNLLDAVSINTSLFHTSEDDSEGYTYFDVLEQVFTFLNLTIYQEEGKYHITQYDNNNFRVRNLNTVNMDCQINKTSTYKSFKYTHKPQLKNTEFDLFDAIEDNEARHVKFSKTNPHSDIIKTPNLLLNQVVENYSYRYGRYISDFGFDTLPKPGAALEWGCLSIPSSITYKHKLPKTYKQFTHRPPVWSVGNSFPSFKNYSSSKFESTSYTTENEGYWSMLGLMGADFVKLGVETNSDEQLGLLIHQAIQDGTAPDTYGQGKLTETDVLLFVRNDNASTAKDTKWVSLSQSCLGINTALNKTIFYNACCPLLSFETNIDIDELTQYLSFEVEGKAIMNPEMFIGNRSDYKESKNYPYPAGKCEQLDKETGSEEHGGWMNHYAFKIRLPIEIEIGDNYRFSRNTVHPEWFDGMSFPKVAKKSDKPFSTSDIYMLELMCDTEEYDLVDSNSLFVSLKGKIKPYDIQGQTFKTKYSAASNGLSVGISGGVYGLKDIEDCNVIAFNNTIGARGKLKCTIFNIPVADLYSASGTALSGDTAMDGLYRYVGYWLQGFFITKFKIKEHQSNEIFYEKIYDKDNDDDVEYTVKLNEGGFEEFDNIECIIGNHNSLVTPISRPSLIKYYKINEDSEKIVLSKTAPISTDVFTPKDNTYNVKEIDLWTRGKAVKMEDYTTSNIKRQYSDSNIILDIKTHINGFFNCMSYYYQYPWQFDGYFVTNSVTYNLKNNIAELNLQQKR